MLKRDSVGISFHVADSFLSKSISSNACLAPLSVHVHVLVHARTHALLPRCSAIPIPNSIMAFPFQSTHLVTRTLIPTHTHKQAKTHMTAPSFMP